MPLLTFLKTSDKLSELSDELATYFPVELEDDFLILDHVAEFRILDDLSGVFSYDENLI